MLSSKEIIKSIHEGDDRVTVLLYRAYRNDFIKWALRNHRCNEDDAKDIFQDIIISFYHKVREQKITSIDSSLKTYLFSCGKNQLLNLSKKNQKFIDLSGFECINDEMIKIEKMEKLSQDKLLIEKALKELPEADQKILKMFYFDNCDLETISKILGYKNANVVKTKKSACLKKMISIMDKISNGIKMLVL